MITDSQAKAGPFVGDGMTTEYDFAFPALSADHIAVYVDKVKITSGYTAALLPGGGRVTLDDPLPEGARLAIVRDVPFEQVVDLQNNTAFLPEVIETALDRLTMICQQLRESLSRAVTLPPTDTGRTWDEIYLTLIQAIADASTSTKGIIQIATGAEVTAGTDTAKAVVPATLKTELDKKVDKVEGKGLSANDYDNTEKAKVGKIELETLAELTGANVTIAPWTQSKWSASGTCSLTASGWAASGLQIAYIVITLAAGATPSIIGTEAVAEDDALIAAGVYECYIKNVDGKIYFRVISFTEAA
jgi:hypothetical protein